MECIISSRVSAPVLVCLLGACVPSGSYNAAERATENNQESVPEETDSNSATNNGQAAQEAETLQIGTSGNRNRSSCNLWIQPGHDLATKIERAKSGARICLAAGVHRLHREVRIRHPLAIFGYVTPNRKSVTEVRLIRNLADEKAMIRIDTPSMVHLEGIFFNANKKRVHSMVYVHGGKVNIRNNKFQGPVPAKPICHSNPSHTKCSHSGSAIQLKANAFNKSQRDITYAAIVSNELKDIGGGWKHSDGIVVRGRNILGRNNIKNLYIHHNTIDRVGRTGIAVHWGVENVSIQHNRVTNTGSAHPKDAIWLGNENFKMSVLINGYKNGSREHATTKKANIAHNRLDNWVSIIGCRQCALRSNFIDSTHQGSNSRIGIELINVQKSIIVNNRIRGRRETGVTFGANNRFNLVMNNDIHGRSTSNKNHYIKHGIRLGNGDDSPKDPFIRWNYFFGNRINNLHDNGKGFLALFSKNAIYQNVFGNNKGSMDFHGDRGRSNSMRAFARFNNNTPRFYANTGPRSCTGDFCRNDSLQSWARFNIDRVGTRKFRVRNATSGRHAKPSKNVRVWMLDWGEGVPSFGHSLPDQFYSYPRNGNRKVRLIVWDQNLWAGMHERLLEVR